MERYLSKISQDTIFRKAGLRHGDIEHLIDNQNFKILDLLQALFGIDIFENKEIRRLFFEQLPEDDLRVLAKEYCQKIYSKKRDNALILSSLPWRSSSPIAYEVGERYGIPEIYMPKKSRKNETVEEVVPFSPVNALFDYQKKILDEVREFLDTGKNKAIIQMPTGSGKTRTSIELIIEVEKKENFLSTYKSIIWLAHTEELCEQAIETFKKIWGTKGAETIKVVRCWGNYNPKPCDYKSSFVVCSLQKMYSMLKQKNDKFSELASSAKIVVIDEAHKLVAPSYLKVLKKIEKFNDQVICIGLTATPGRPDEGMETYELVNFFKGNIFSPYKDSNAIVELRDKGILSKLKRIEIPSGVTMDVREYCEKAFNSTFDFSKVLLKNLAKNKQRNEIIIKTIKEHVDQNNPTIVFSCSVEHSRILAAALSLDGYQVGYVDSTLSRARRTKTISDFKNGYIDILINYGILTTGFDSPRIKTVVITRPTSSIVLYSQMIGRGLRGPKVGGSEECNLVDILDNFKNFGEVHEIYEFFKSYWT